MDREVRPKHKAPWLRKLNKNAKHQKRAARASVRRRKSKARYRKTKGRHTHRAVAERVIGRPLTYDEIVHHVDEDKRNNDPANLDIGITRRQHQHIHAWLRRNGERPKVMNLLRRKGRVAGIKYKFKTTPYRHQVKALKKMILRRGGGLAMEMGTGKSKVAIDFACAMHLKTGVDRVVICCPKSVTSVWKLEIPKHAPEHIRKRIKWVIINYDRLYDREVERDGETYIYKGKKHALKKFLGGAGRKKKGKSLLIGDEGHLLKTPSAERSKAMYQMRQEADYYLHLTGTPLTKHILDWYHQFKLINEKVFGTNKAHFEKQFTVWGGYGNYTLLRYINLDKFKELATPWIFQAKKDQCLDLPSRTDVIVPVKLTGKNKQLYRQMAQDGLIKVKGKEYDTEIMLTRILRCQQLASGFITGEDKKPVSVGHDKERKLDSLLKDMQSQERKKIVIFCQFIHDVKVCAKVAKRNGYKYILFHGGTSDGERERALLKFDETDEPTIFITQIAAGSLGITLTAASEAIFYSHTNNFAQFAQAKDRLHRIGQHHPVTYYHLIAPGVDQAIWIANKTKKNVADLLLSKPKLLMEEGYSS